ncbi:hypothetical protein HSBAA_21150 [Vreelandella sulfidaeris]|uniref:Phosphate ABC transporter substrate-binding protein n=1 Tax=Vreelandella sulfidaeris TaxID=115553 RepID=A0A455U7J9_9GAMM|nr:hypothetical protein HSBAA_21150 [Halomonas sulfidaeris]
MSFSSFSFAADLVVIGHPSAETLTKNQVADIYLGKTSSGTLYDLPEGSDLYASFYDQAAGRNVSQVKSTWARIVFSGQAQAPKQLNDSNAVRSAVAENPNAIGYIEKSALDDSVKVLLELN